MRNDNALLTEFIKITNDNKEKKNVNLYGTVTTLNGVKCVKMDGSDILTPVNTTTDIDDNERVIVSIDNHIATVTGNITNPSASGSRVDVAEGSIDRFDHLFAGNISAGNISAGSITADKILAGAITTDKLMAESVTASKIKAGTITADKIEAGAITADKIEAGAITTDKIHAGAITADKIQAGSIGAGNVIITEGAIGSAQISNLEASKITSGTIDTSKISIAGADGHLKLVGNRMQVFDGVGNNAVERVSIGDVDNDGKVFGLRVRGADGETILIDENGVTSEGITDGSIKNEHISGESKIDGFKLDINSVVREINGATETISGTKIDIDGTSISTTLSKLETTQTEQGNTISNNTSNIKANEDSIKLKVDGQVYQTDKDELYKAIEKNTSGIDILEKGIDLKVSESISKVGVGANNYVDNSGGFINADKWSGDVELKDKLLHCKGEVVNTTNINLEPDTYYVLSAIIELPEDFIMTETNLLKYLVYKGVDI